MATKATEELAAIKLRLKKIRLPWKNRNEGLRLLQRAAALGDAEACEELGMWYRDGDEVSRGKKTFKKNSRLELKYFRLAANAGLHGGMTGLADALTRPYLFKSAPSSRKDLNEGIRWYKKACKLQKSSYFNLGITYRYLRDHKRATHCFKQAAWNGDAGAVYEVANAELYGLGAKRNVPGALEKLKSIANSDRAQDWERGAAMILISQVLRDGVLVARDYNQSIDWLWKATKVGSEAARGILKDEGINVE